MINTYGQNNLTADTTTFVMCSAFRVISFLYFFFVLYYYYNYNCYYYLIFLKSLVYFSVFLPIFYINLLIKHILYPVKLGALPVEIPFSFVKRSRRSVLVSHIFFGRCAVPTAKTLHKIPLHLSDSYRVVSLCCNSHPVTKKGF